MDPAFESISSFAKRINLPDGLVRAMVKQGRIPHIKTGKTHVRIHIEAALEAVKHHAEQNAGEIAMTMPLPINVPVPVPVPRAERKYKGRPPDAVRLGKKTAGC